MSSAIPISAPPFWTTILPTNGDAWRTRGLRGDEQVADRDEHVARVYERHAVTRKLGAFRTSMQNDVEAGRPIELDALVGAVLEMGRITGVPTPAIDALFGLTRLFGRVHGLYP